MKKVLITGASRGIGKCIKEKFLKEGYDVFCPTREELDLSNEESVNKFIEKYSNEKIDIIINNAGINEINLIEDIKDEEMKNMFAVNLVTPIKIIRTFVKGMKERKFGRIINISSIWGVISKEGRCVYSATKNGIHGVTNTLAIELAPYNILVNTICPGFTLTNLTKKNNTKEQIEEIAKEIPLKRMAYPEEIADAVYYLGCSNNTYITGQKLIIDGGYSSK